MNPSEINQENNELYRLFQKFSRESKLTILSSVSSIVALLALLMSWSAVNSATRAVAKVDYELTATRQELLITKNEIRMLEVFIDQLIDAMKDNDIATPEKK